mmetsp:Transcript_28371/g.76782  ORF Transcript_28371/g.76782 Transcript_28371/m.76782 type:complete len:297 (-) Transcript_28371:93-983(-)
MDRARDVFLHEREATAAAARGRQRGRVARRRGAGRRDRLAIWRPVARVAAERVARPRGGIAARGRCGHPRARRSLRRGRRSPRAECDIHADGSRRARARRHGGHAEQARALAARQRALPPGVALADGGRWLGRRRGRRGRVPQRRLALRGRLRRRRRCLGHDVGLHDADELRPLDGIARRGRAPVRGDDAPARAAVDVRREWAAGDAGERDVGRRHRGPLLSRAARRRRRADTDPPLRLRWLPDLDDAQVPRHHGRRLARARRRVRRGQHTGRRRVWAGLAPGGEARPSQQGVRGL